MEGSGVYILEISQSKTPCRGLSPRNVTELVTSEATTKQKAIHEKLLV